MKKRRLLFALVACGLLTTAFVGKAFLLSPISEKRAIATDTFTDVYSTGFEGFSTTTTYNSPKSYDANTNESVGWYFYYGTVSTSSAITDSNSAHMRWYSKYATNYPYMNSTTNVNNVDKISFKYAVSNRDVHFTVYSGSADVEGNVTWTSIATVAPSGTIATELTYYLDTKVENFRLKIAVNNTGAAPSSGNYTFRVDDVVFSSSVEENQPSITISTPNNQDSGQIGDKIQFSKVVSNYDGDVIWDSSDTAVATIDNDGLVSLKGIGSTIIRCTSGDVKSNAITIKSYPVADSTLSISEAITVAELSGSEKSPYSYYAFGIVTNSTNYSFDLKDTESDEYIYVYKSNHGKSNDELVKVYGKLKKYNNSTLEFDSPTIDAITGKAAIQYALPKANLVFGVNTQQEIENINGYEKVTVAPSDWSGEYLIVSENNLVTFDGSLETLDAIGNVLDVDIDNNYIDSIAELDAATFTIDKTANGYSIKSSSGNYIGQTSDANGLKSSSETIDNSISLNNDGNVDIVSRGAYLRFNSASNQNRFRYYKSSSYTDQKDIQLYKKVNERKKNIYTPKNVKVNLGTILDGMNVLEFEDDIVSYGVAVATADNLRGEKLKDVLNEKNYVGKSEVTLAETPFVYCDSQGRAPGDEDKGFVENTDNYIIFSANLAVPEANYTTELTWAAYFILRDNSIVMTTERTESVETLAESYKANETLYNSFDEDVQKCIDYLAAYND